MKNPFTVEADKIYLDQPVLKGFKYNGTYIPSIKSIIFNKSMKKSMDGKRTFESLGTCIIFSDGTKSSVSSSELDAPSKELGIIYALAKRVLQPVGDKDRVKSEGFMGLVRKLVNMSVDQTELRAQTAKRKEDQKNENVKRQEKMHEHAMKRKEGKLTIGQRMRSVETILAALADQIARNQKIVPPTPPEEKKAPKKNVKKVAKKTSRK